MLCRVFVVYTLATSVWAISITQFGAISNDGSDATSAINAAALLKTFLAAHASSTDRVVLVPAGGNFTIFPTYVSAVNNISFQVDGILTVNNNITATAWTRGGVDYGVVQIVDSSDLEVRGAGLYDGQGYTWWWYVFLTTGDWRPHMLMMQRCVNVLIHELTFHNSPQYHMLLEDMLGLVVRDLTM